MKIVILEAEQIFLCKPSIYEDTGDCEILYDIRDLCQYFVLEMKPEKYKRFRSMFDDAFYDEIMEKVKGKSAYEAPMVLTKVDYRTNYAKEINELLRATYSSHIKIFESMIPQNIKVAEASADGKSIYDYAPKSTLLKKKYRSKIKTTYIKLITFDVGG